MNLLSLTSINDYVNSNVINKYKAKNQKGRTCYANAISASICLSSAKVLGRPELNFYEIRKEWIDKYGVDGADTFSALEEYLKNIKYKLHSREVNENRARNAIMKTRICVARFYLTARQWGNFKKFFNNNPKDIITKEIINEPFDYPDQQDGGHAVVLTHISKDYLKLLNSWGINWGDNGYFKVKNADVLNIKFREIFWGKNDLSRDEINYYNYYMNILENEIKQSLFD